MILRIVCALVPLVVVMQAVYEHHLWCAAAMAVLNLLGFVEGYWRCSEKTS
jgi:hypothetical protein